MHSNPRILVVHPFGIGDVLFTLPFLDRAKRLYPQAYIGFLCNRRTESLLRNVSLINDIFVYEKDEFRALREQSKIKALRHYFGLTKALQRAHFEYAFDLSMNREYGALLWVAGIKRRIGYNFKNRGGFLNYRVDLPGGYAEKHVAEYCLELLKTIFPDPCPGPILRPGLIAVPEPLKKRARRVLQGYLEDAATIVAIAPAGGKSWGKEAPRKYWPSGCYASLINRLLEDESIRIVLLASEEERPVVQAVYQGVLGKNKVMNLSGALSLEELPAFISECGLLIANDGGPLHLAVFLGIPTLSLFGPTDERVYGPFLTGENRKNHSVLCVQAQCRPCYQGFRLKQCFKGYGCWETISPEQAFAAAKKLLNNSARDLNQEETHVEFRN